MTDTIVLGVGVGVLVCVTPDNAQGSFLVVWYQRFELGVTTRRADSNPILYIASLTGH